MKTGDLVILRRRWSYKSVYLGIILGYDLFKYVVFWCEDGNYVLDEHSKEELCVIEDHDLRIASDRWKITNP